MSLVSDVIADVRVEINDTSSTRFPNDTAIILPIVKQAIRRANRICQRSQLHFAKKSAALVTVAGQNYVTMPVDMDNPIGIWRDDRHSKIEQLTESEWQLLIAPTELEYWFLDLQNSKILLSGTPQSVINMTMWYYPTIDVSAYTTGTTMPWNGKLDDIISRYVALRIQNIEEMNTAVDQSILNEMEQGIITTYAPLNPLIISQAGWL